MENYFEEGMRQSDFGGGMIVPKYKRPLETYVKALKSAGFFISDISEPQPIKKGKKIDVKGYETAMRLPQVLTVKLIKLEKKNEWQNWINCKINIHQLTEYCYPGLTARITYLTIFAKDNNDYNHLVDKLSQLGIKKEANNGFAFELSKSLNLQGDNIHLIRIRKPDIHRKEEGCADIQFKNKAYEELRTRAIEKGLDVIVRKKFEMIELSNFDINVYAYIVKLF